MANGITYSENTIAPRLGEAFDEKKLQHYLSVHLPEFAGNLAVKQFPGGYSNLSFLIENDALQYVLRMPPVGANIKSAHDMGREYRVLCALKPHYKAVPTPVLYCDDLTILGQPFYIMERMNGIILRNKIPQGIDLSQAAMHAISTAAIENLAGLHNINIEETGLISLGKPEGYLQRQVEGWVKRYFASQTDEIAYMQMAADWLLAHMPKDADAAFIHNDYKYDNLVLDANDLTKIVAVLDWEMATVGNPLMDLGTTLGYWAEANDSKALQAFNLTWLRGNLTREEVVITYAAERNIPVPDMVFYFVFGSFKIATIVQQIYARYKQGITSDQRFSQLIDVVNACANNAQKAIAYNRISHFY